MCFAKTGYHCHFGVHLEGTVTSMPACSMWQQPSPPTAKRFFKHSTCSKSRLQKGSWDKLWFVWKKKKNPLIPQCFDASPENDMELNKHTLQKERRVSWLNKGLGWYKQILFNIRVLPHSSLKIMLVIILCTLKFKIYMLNVASLISKGETNIHTEMHTSLLNRHYLPVSSYIHRQTCPMTTGSLCTQ